MLGCGHPFILSKAPPRLDQEQLCPTRDKAKIGKSGAGDAAGIVGVRCDGDLDRRARPVAERRREIGGDVDAFGDPCAGALPCRSRPRSIRARSV